MEWGRNPPPHLGPNRRKNAGSEAFRNAKTSCSNTLWYRPKIKANFLTPGSHTHLRFMVIWLVSSLSPAIAQATWSPCAWASFTMLFISDQSIWLAMALFTINIALSTWKTDHKIEMFESLWFDFGRSRTKTKDADPNQQKKSWSGLATQMLSSETHTGQVRKGRTQMEMDNWELSAEGRGH